MSKYKAVWEILKKNKTCELTAIAAGHHLRIRKAVTKAKDLDIKFKNETDGAYVLRTLFKENGNILFTLEVRVGKATINDM